MSPYLLIRGLLTECRLLPVLLLLGRASLASAQEAPSPAENTPSVVEPPAQELTEIQTGSGSPGAVALVGDVALGIGPQHRNGSGFALDATMRLRLSTFEIGAVAGNWGTIIGSAESYYYGILAGYRHAIGDSFELELLAEGGQHDERVSPGELFGPHAYRWVVLPYAGLRAGIDARLGGRLRLVIGLWGVLRADLKTEHVVVDSYDLGMAGGLSGAIQLRLGFELGLGKKDEG